MVRATARLLVSAGGAAFVVAAIFCDAAWFERHIALPCFSPAPPSWLHGVIRAGLAAVGLLLLAGAGPLCRRATPGGVARVGIALLLALCASEWILRRFGLTARAVRAKRAEHILGGADARYGWVLLPSRTTLLGPPVRPVPYSID